MIPEILNQWDLFTKSHLQEELRPLIQKIKDGEKEALPTLCIATAIVKAFEDLIKEIRDIAASEADMFHKADANIKGIKFSTYRSPDKHSFTHVKEWVDLSFQIAILKSSLAIVEERSREQLPDSDGCVLERPLITKQGGLSVRIELP